MTSIQSITDTRPRGENRVSLRQGLCIVQSDGRAALLQASSIHVRKHQRSACIRQEYEATRDVNLAGRAGGGFWGECATQPPSVTMLSAG